MKQLRLVNFILSKSTITPFIFNCDTFIGCSPEVAEAFVHALKYVDKFVKRLKYRVSNFKLKKVKFVGLDVYGPDPTLRYIKEHYGDDWMVPKIPFKNYFYNKSPTSLVQDI